jgi:hypothetical protein
MKMYERLTDDRRALTLSVANGFAISMSPEAARAWQAENTSPDSPAAPITGPVLGLMMAQFPSAFKVH